uniref:GPI-anchor transamidase component GPAA1 n=1 Tax=Timema shepardi TaxID=629360 RepID=A0A7R9B3U4_TIMSH|nr:unnamed protein product [Timema shepardi]
MEEGAGKQERTQVFYCEKIEIVHTLLPPHKAEITTSRTYFSENALLPGLVKGDFDEDMTAKNYQSELLEESSRYPDSVPYPWLLAKFRQLSLDVYTHNFTLNYPLGYGTKYTGKNVYAILRAPRSASTEALVLSVPYRSPSSAHPGTMPSIALMLSLAKFFRRQKYWAKDVIFLVTEHEQLGVQAWLEAYHQTTCGRSGVLDHGDMTGRGGAIQAAINLELHAEKIGHVDVKVEGLNGQLPNLDLVNLVHRMCSKEGVKHTFKNRENSNHRDPMKEWFHQLKTLMAMVTTQATGIPNGNHGLFHRFGIEAVTLEGFEKKEKGSPAVFYQLGRVMEGLFRSLNNLLERFHQSYFFYLQPTTDRYISIGMYMPPLGLLCAALLIKAFGLWLRMQKDPADSASAPAGRKGDEDILEVDKEEQSGEGDGAYSVEQQVVNFSLVPVGVAVLATHILGVALLSAPRPFTTVGLEWGGLATETSIYVGYVVAALVMILIPLLASSIGGNMESWTLLNIVALLELATLLLAVSMQNFSLALLAATIYTPPALWMTPAKNRSLSLPPPPRESNSLAILSQHTLLAINRHAPGRMTSAGTHPSHMCSLLTSSPPAHCGIRRRTVLALNPPTRYDLLFRAALNDNPPTSRPTYLLPRHLGYFPTSSLWILARPSHHRCYLLTTSLRPKPAGHRNIPPFPSTSRLPSTSSSMPSAAQNKYPVSLPLEPTGYRHTLPTDPDTRCRHRAPSYSKATAQRNQVQDWCLFVYCRFLSVFQKLLWLLLHPLLLLTIVVSIFTLITFPELPWDEVLDRSLGATKQALVFAIIDSSVYGNWVFSVATAILTPNWLIFWLVLNSKPLSCRRVKD